MTKSEYQEYLGSRYWRWLRMIFLDFKHKCERCSMPRWQAPLAYGQDLHVHHTSYAHVGKPNEIFDLEALCRGCHEIETFGRSDLREWEKEKGVMA